eukprot:1161034-Pelagomonas_calceolata.AAC.9
MKEGKTCVDNMCRNNNAEVCQSDCLSKGACSTCGQKSDTQPRLLPEQPSKGILVTAGGKDSGDEFMPIATLLLCSKATSIGVHDSLCFAGNCSRDKPQHILLL